VPDADLSTLVELFVTPVERRVVLASSSPSSSELASELTEECASFRM
jgi:hypothetical protein